MILTVSESVCKGGQAFKRRARTEQERQVREMAIGRCRRGQSVKQEETEALGYNMIVSGQWPIDTRGKDDRQSSHSGYSGVTFYTARRA